MAPVCPSQSLSILKFSSLKKVYLFIFVKLVSDTYLTPIHIVKNKVELLWGLEGVVEPNQKRVFQTLQQHISLCHNVLLLKSEKRNISTKTE